MGRVGHETFTRGDDRRQILGRIEVVAAHRQQLLARPAILPDGGLVDVEQPQRLAIDDDGEKGAGVEQPAIARLHGLELGQRAVDDPERHETQDEEGREAEKAAQQADQGGCHDQPAHAGGGLDRADRHSGNDQRHASGGDRRTGLRAGLEHQLAVGVEDALAHLAFVGLGHLDELAQAVRLVLPKLLVGVDVLGQPIGLEIGREGKLMVELRIGDGEIAGRHDQRERKRHGQPKPGDQRAKPCARSSHRAPATSPRSRSRDRAAGPARKSTKALASALGVAGATR